MSEMIDRVRQAIMASDNCPGPRVPPPVGPCAANDLCACYRSARAAIEAMREPTEAMLLSFWDKQQGHDFRPDETSASEWYGDLRDMRAGFAAAIDEALK